MYAQLSNECENVIKLFTSNFSSLKTVMFSEKPKQIFKLTLILLQISEQVYFLHS